MIVVTLYTKKGKAQVVEGVFCKHCLESSSSSSDSEGEESMTVLTKKPEDKESELSVEELHEMEKLETKSTEPLLEQQVKEIPLEQTKTPLDLTETERISRWNIIWTLNWLNTKLMLKDWKRFILPAACLLIWILCLIINSKFSFPIEKCPDGRYSSQ